MLAGQVLIRRKEAELVISPRLHNILQVEDIGVGLPRSDREKEALLRKGVLHLMPRSGELSGHGVLLTLNSRFQQ